MKHASQSRAMRRRTRRRRGTVLIPVLVVTLILAGTACAFIDLIVTERTAIDAATRRAQSHESMRSGVEVLLAWLDRKAERRDELLAHLDMTMPRVIVESDIAGDAAVVAWIAPDAQEGRLSLRPGIADESGRLNVNALPLEKQFARQARQTLMQLDGMTVHVADAILDWIDADDEPREYGAETSYYSSLPRPTKAANAPLRHIEELLQVRGVTPELLLGDEMPARAESRELPRKSRSASRFASIETAVPWVHLLTAHSAESNVRPDGRPLIDVNQENLVRLFDELEQEIGPEAARFIVAYRLAGPIHGGEEVRVTDDEDGTTFDDPATDREEARRQQARDRAQSQRGESAAPRASAEAETTRAGLNLKYRPAYRIRSLFDLIGAEVHVPIRNVDEILESPWPAEGSKMQSLIDELSQRIATEPGRVVRGRINPRCAPRSVLRGVDGMTAELADRVIAARRRPPGDPRRGRRNLGWLIEEGVLDLAALRSIASRLTIRDGDVSRAYCIGRSANGRHPVGAEILIDGSQRPSRVLWERSVADSEWGALKTALGSVADANGTAERNHSPLGTLSDSR